MFRPESVDLLKAGGSAFMVADGPFNGPGRVGILVENGQTGVSVHFYDGTRQGMPTLAIRPLRGSVDGWPLAKAVP